MFRNLYAQLRSSFPDHNFCDSLDRLDSVSETYIQGQIELGLDGEPIELYFDDVLTLTMHPDSCQSFLRTNASWPITERDYYLSKLFQFMYLPIKLRFEPDDTTEAEVRERLEAALDAVPDELLPGFDLRDWWEFYKDVSNAELTKILDQLPSYLPGAKRASDLDRPSSGKRGPKPDIENHRKIVDVITKHGPNWKEEDELYEVAKELERLGVPPSKTWEKKDPPSRSWTRAAENYPDLVIKVIEHRMNVARQHAPRD